MSGCQIPKVVIGHCQYCYQSIFADEKALMNEDGLFYCIPNCQDKNKREETITIKKALWDEMVECKSKIEWCINEIKSLMSDIAFNRRESQERLDYLAEYKSNVDKLVSNDQDSLNGLINQIRIRDKEIKELQERIEKIEAFAYSEGDVGAINGQLENLHNNFDHLDFEMQVLRKHNLELCDRIEKLEERISSTEKDLNHVPSFERLNEIDDGLYGLIQAHDSRIKELEKSIAPQQDRGGLI